MYGRSLNAYISVEKMVKKNEVHQLCRNVVLRCNPSEYRLPKFK